MTSARITRNSDPQPPKLVRIARHFVAPCFRATDNQDALVPQVLAERRRRELWANCELRPVGHDRGRG